MRLLATTLLFVSGAVAAPRYDITKMPCAQVQARIAADGLVVLILAGLDVDTSRPGGCYASTLPQSPARPIRAAWLSRQRARRAVARSNGRTCRPLVSPISRPVLPAACGQVGADTLRDLGSHADGFAERRVGMNGLADVDGVGAHFDC